MQREQECLQVRHSNDPQQLRAQQVPHPTPTLERVCKLSYYSKAGGMLQSS